MIDFNHTLRTKINKKRRLLIRIKVKIKDMIKKSNKKLDDKWYLFFNQAGKLLLQTIELESSLTNDFVFTQPLKVLKKLNYDVHKERLPKYYNTSFANPSYSVECFGNKVGQLNSLIYSRVLTVYKCAYENDVLTIFQVANMFIEYYRSWKKLGVDYDTFLTIIKENEYESIFELQSQAYEKRFSVKYDFNSLWIKTVDLTDLRYLFYFGNYVSDDVLKMAEYINTLPQERVDQVMHQTAAAYILSFSEGNKNYKKKKTVSLTVPMGMERLALSLMLELENRYDLKVCIPQITTEPYDEQFQYDHRFDDALYLDDEYTEKLLTAVKKIIFDLSKVIKVCSGRILFDPFGYPPFKPENKISCLKYSEEQTKLSHRINSETSLVLNKYFRRNESSYCIIGFPTPAIGDNFSTIFEKVIEINTLEHNQWLEIQKLMIDALDQGDVVHVKGYEENHTDIYVKLPSLENPDSQTNFFNCGATVNIPVGEVFTTPQFSGTKGVLHTPEIFLNGLLFKDLELTFEEGRIVDYKCKNYESENENKKYIEENLFFPHNFLPMSEFAIGTNTLAYSVAKKYKIISVLPILIIEKMGPHFAIGDSCYSWEEDTPVFNPDNKEIIARDNDQSILRKTNIKNAYYNLHLDITLPYDEIGFIKVILKNKKTIEIIKKGKFVLPGTEELNKYL